MKHGIYKATRGNEVIIGDTDTICTLTDIPRGSVASTALQGILCHGWSVSYYVENEEEETYRNITEHLDEYGNTIAMDDKMFERLKRDGYNIETRFVREGEFWVIETKSRSRGNQERDC